MTPQNLIDAEAFARRRLPKSIYDYYRSGDAALTIVNRTTAPKGRGR